jgi:hypothetical protein
VRSKREEKKVKKVKGEDRDLLGGFTPVATIRDSNDSGVFKETDVIKVTDRITSTAETLDERVSGDGPSAHVVLVDTCSFIKVRATDGHEEEFTLTHLQTVIGKSADEGLLLFRREKVWVSFIDGLQLTTLLVSLLEELVLFQKLAALVVDADVDFVKIPLF